MELCYMPLPKTLQSTTIKDIPNVIIYKLQYLWKLSHELLLNTPSTINNTNNTSNSSKILSGRLSKQFMDIIITNNIQLPNEYQQKICPFCCILQIPTITCTMRLENNFSKNNKKNKNHKNKVARLCLHCKFKTMLPGYIKKMKTTTLQIKQKDHIISQSNTINTNEVMQNPNKKFSFHEILQKKSISNEIAKIESEDFIPLSSNNTIEGNDMIIDPLTKQKRYLTLIEREEMKRKSKKQKKLSTSNTISSSSIKQFIPSNKTNGNNSSNSLSSLKQLFRSS